LSARLAQAATAAAQTQGPKQIAGHVVTVIRLRGTQNLNPKTKDTLKYLRLNRVNHAVVLAGNETTVGMLQVAKDYVTWGEVDAATLAAVIKSRGRVAGNNPLTEAHLAANTPFKTVDALAAAIVEGKFQYKDIPDIKPLFRLHPARQGLEGIKRSVQNGGALGYRGKDINRLLGRMLGEGTPESEIAMSPAKRAAQQKVVKAGEKAVRTEAKAAAAGHATKGGA
jgi:large subunit ribosomal protein L30